MPSAGRLQPRPCGLHVLVRHDRGADARIGELQREEGAANAGIGAGRAQLGVAAGMLGAGSWYWR